jgi:hypothetical protein
MEKNNDLTALDFAAVDRRFLANVSESGVPWDLAPAWACYAYSAPWFLLWLQNEPTAIIQDEVVVDGRVEHEPNAIVWPAAGLVKRPKTAAMPTRAEYARAWKAWKKANHIRRATAALTGNRNGPAKAWADECRVMLARAERNHRRALRA